MESIPSLAFSLIGNCSLRLLDSNDLLLAAAENQERRGAFASEGVRSPGILSEQSPPDQAAHAGDVVRFRFYLRQSAQQQGGQNRNDSYGHQQLNEREAKTVRVGC